MYLIINLVNLLSAPLNTYIPMESAQFIDLVQLIIASMCGNTEWLNILFDEVY